MVMNLKELIKDCYDRTGAADNTFCGEFETNTDGVELLDLAGNEINYRPSWLRS